MLFDISNIDNVLVIFLLGCEVSNIMKEGMIEDWDAFENLLDYAYDKCIKSDSQYHPVLCSEAAWNARGKREKICELFFEKYQVNYYLNDLYTNVYKIPEATTVAPSPH